MITYEEKGKLFVCQESTQDEIMCLDLVFVVIQYTKRRKSFYCHKHGMKIRLRGNSSFRPLRRKLRHFDKPTSNWQKRLLKAKGELK